MSGIPEWWTFSELRQTVRTLLAARRFASFLAVGMAGVIVDNAVLIAVVEGNLLTPVSGAVVSKECAIIVNFALNERFTFAGFGGGGLRQRGRRFLTSNLVRIGGAAVAIAVLYGLYTWFGVWYVLANVVGIGVGFVVNYTFESLATWRVHD